MEKFNWYLLELLKTAGIVVSVVAVGVVSYLVNLFSN